MKVEVKRQRLQGKMRFLPLSPRCPSCGSRDITYTCEPECCFNHVCNGCQASFLLATEKAGPSPCSERGELPEADRAGLPTAGPENPLAPTVGCARCESTAVYELEGGLDAATHVCGECFALLTFGAEEVQKN